MGIIDIIIIGIIILGAIIGAKNGFTKQVVSFIGLLAVVILAFIFKNTVSIWMFQNLPFFKFGGIFKGVTVLNILLYEVIAFIIVFCVLMLIYKILLKITGLFEKILNATIVLSIPSKILGAIVGALEYFVLTFIILYITSLPFLSVKILEDSKLRMPILNRTPILSSVSNESVAIIDDFNLLKEKYTLESDANQFNLEALDLLLKYKLTTIESIDKLIEKDKLSIKNIDSILNNYR